MNRFVILEHDHPTLHWDLMLECDGVLRTWRLARPPEGPEQLDATPIADHRLMYLDYEGPVSGGRGTVKRWDRGTYEMLIEEGGMTRVRLEGEKVQRVVELPTATQ